MTERLALCGGRVLTSAGDLASYTLLLEGSHVEGLLAPGEPLPPDVKQVAVDGCVVAPGFIDTHVHGALGRNFMEGTPEAFLAISQHLVQGGVTACLATTTSASLPALLGALTYGATLAAEPMEGCVEVLGMHLEGPFVNPRYKGSHAEAFIRQPTQQELQAIAEAAGPALKVVTLAPELPGGFEATRFFAGQGVQVSLGHTAATYQQAKGFLANGGRRGTHLFNAMPPIHHREPGPVVALLEDAGAFLELTVDGRHVSPAVVRMVMDLAGPDRVVLITDCADVAGLGDGVFTRWEGTPVVVQGGEARTPSGSLAGSLLRLDQAVANAVRMARLPLAAALRMASETPARAVGALDRKGVLSPGKDADVVVLDGDLSVLLTVVRGRIIYDRRDIS